MSHTSSPPSPIPSQDTLLADIGDLILSIARALHDPETRDPRITGLSPLELLVVRQVRNHPGASAREIARAARMHSSNLAATLRALEKKAMITRTPDPHDGRGTCIFLTPDAEKNIEWVRDQTAEILGRLPVDVDALAVTYDVLARLDEAIS